MQSPCLLPPPPPRPPARRRSWLTLRGVTMAPPPQKRNPATPATFPPTALPTRTPMLTRSRVLPFPPSQPAAIHHMSRQPCRARLCWLRLVSTNVQIFRTVLLAGLQELNLFLLFNQASSLLMNQLLNAVHYYIYFIQILFFVD